VVRSVAEAADQPYSYVFLTTKAIPERSPTPQILAPLISAPYANSYTQPTYVFLQNGLNVEASLYKALVQLGQGKPSIVSTAVWIGANLIGPNVVGHNHFVSFHVTAGASD
jgi:2-dehydropantoate 2-reductase